MFIFADDFIIGAYDVSKDMLGNAHDSLGLNTISNSSIETDSQAMDILSGADDESLKVLLYHAPAPQGTSPDRGLNWYCDLWHQLLESEDDGTYFLHDEGKAVEDLAASNDSAWVCSLGIDSEGWMQKGKWNHQILSIYTSGQAEYTARFCLQIDDTSGLATTEVCSLVVKRAHPDSTFKDSVLTIGDFQGESVYDTFDLRFIPGSKDLIYYAIYWYANVNLWADYVEVKDCFVDSLTQPPYYYNEKLGAIAELYSPFYCQYKSLYRFYLRDEPRYGHFAANAYVMEFLEEGANYQYGIQTLGGLDKEFFAFYAYSVKPQELWFDYYPFFGWGYNDSSRTPEDCGALFQARLDT